MSDDNSAVNNGITSDERIRNVLRRLIKRAFDKHEFTRPTLAKESGVRLCHIDAIMTTGVDHHRRVATEDAFNLAYTLGEHAVSTLLGTIHYTAQHIDQHDCDPRAMVADGLRHFTVLAEAAADGRIDHTEAPRCREAADSLIAIVSPLSSAGVA